MVMIKIWQYLVTPDESRMRMRYTSSHSASILVEDWKAASGMRPTMEGERASIHRSKKQDLAKSITPDRASLKLQVLVDLVLTRAFNLCPPQ